MARAVLMVLMVLMVLLPLVWAGKEQGKIRH
jgi:hypothetical protein